jgi:hypothetical protein
MNENNPIKKQILALLTNYGLNPLEWDLSGLSLSEKAFVLKNRSDSEFQLMGFLDHQSKTPVLKSLELISL